MIYLNDADMIALVPSIFPGGKWPGRGVGHPPPSSNEVKENVELYLHPSFGSSLPVTP